MRVNTFTSKRGARGTCHIMTRMAEFKLRSLCCTYCIFFFFYRQNKYNTHINTECPQCAGQAHSPFLMEVVYSHGLCNIKKSQLLRANLNPLKFKHQNALYEVTCSSKINRKRDECNHCHNHLLHFTTGSLKSHDGLYITSCSFCAL